MKDDTNFQRKYGAPGVSCLYKLNWSTIRLWESSVGNCHRVDASKVTPHNFDRFHNTPETLKARAMMQKGEWPGHGCEYCRDLEELGGTSDRMMLNNLNDGVLKYYVPQEIIDNPLAIETTPKIVEVYFSNKCNMACLYCSPAYSTTWQAEERKWGFSGRDGKSGSWTHRPDRQELEEAYPVIKARFWEWMHENATELHEYKILGGEPFYQDELWENLEFFENNPCPNLKLWLFSNLKVSSTKFKSVIERFQSLLDKKHLRQIELVSSIDGFGPQEEYVRFGLDMAQWERNWQTLNEYTDIRAHAHFTLCNLNIKCAADLIRYINDNNGGNLSMSFALADSLTHLNQTIFPRGFFDSDFDAMIEAAPVEGYKRQLAGFKDRVNAGPYDKEMVYALKDYLDDVDKRRNLDWRTTFEWLRDFDPEAYTE